MNIIDLETPSATEKYYAPKPADTGPFWIPEYGRTEDGIPCHQLRLNSPLACFQYVLSGSGVILCGGTLYTVSAGDTFYLPRHTDHIYYSNPDNRFSRLWINVTGELCPALTEVYGIRDQVVFRNCDSRQLLEALQAACRNAPTPEAYGRDTAPMFLSLIQLLAAHKAQVLPPAAPVEEIRLYLDRHIPEDPGLSRVAAHFSYSREHIIRVFRGTYGITPHQYVLQSRIRMAMILLRTTSLPVQAVSERLHFSDPRHFSTVFAKYVGCSPSRYRKLQT